MVCDTRIHNLLQYLGITQQYHGYFQMTAALQLCLEQPERLTLVTKMIYPDVAKKYNTRWQCVEKNLRTVVNIVWTKNPFRLENINHSKLLKKPSVTQFLLIVLNYMESYNTVIPMQQDSRCNNIFGNISFTGYDADIEAMRYQNSL